MAAVAVAAEGASFEDVTGELDVRRVRVRTAQETPDPMPYGEVADLTWRMPSVLPRRAEHHPLFWWALLAAIPAGGAVVAAAALVMGGA